MGHAEVDQSVRQVGAAMGEAIGIFMLHPETFGESIAAGYANPLAGYVAGRGGVLGAANGTAVSAVFTVFEPNFTGACWDEGVGVRVQKMPPRCIRTRSPGSAAGTSPVPRVLTASPHWGRRSLPSHRAAVYRCTPAGAPCRWPRMPRDERCR